jgi:hypothetical protein
MPGVFILAIGEGWVTWSKFTLAIRNKPSQFGCECLPDARGYSPPHF